MMTCHVRRKRKPLEVQCTPPPRRTHTRRARRGGRCFDLPRPPRRAKFPRFASRFVSPRDEPRSRSDGVRARGSCLTRIHTIRARDEMCGCMSAIKVAVMDELRASEEKMERTLSARHTEDTEMFEDSKLALGRLKELDR